MQEEECYLYVKATVIGKYIDHLVIDSRSKTLGLDKEIHGNSNMEGFGVRKVQTLLLDGCQKNMVLLKENP